MYRDFPFRYLGYTFAITEIMKSKIYIPPHILWESRFIPIGYIIADTYDKMKDLRSKNIKVIFHPKWIWRYSTTWSWSQCCDSILWHSLASIAIPWSFGYFLVRYTGSLYGLAVLPFLGHAADMGVTWLMDKAYRPILN